MQLRYQCLHRWRKIVFSEQEVLNEFTTQIRREIVQYINKDNLTKIRCAQGSVFGRGERSLVGEAK
jgi:hypothetical protein